VVVTLVGLLVTITMPALLRARKMTRSARCKVNLQQLWELFHDTGGDMRLPSPAVWTGFVADRDSQDILICLSDDLDRSASVMLGDVYLVQDPGGLTFYPIMDIVELGDMDLFQLDVFQRSDTVWEMWIGDYTGGDVLANSDADGAVRVTLGGNIMIESLDAPGQWSCGSDHWVCDGPNMGKANWRDDIVRRLTGMSYHEIDPPYVVGGARCSYGMNVDVPRVNGRPSQLLLLDYEKTTADAVAHTVDGEWKYLAPRHMGRVNAVFVDGSVRDLWPSELDPGEGLWRR